MTPRFQDFAPQLRNTALSLLDAWPYARRTSPYTFAAIAAGGLALGIGIGMLAAPQSGEALRRQVVTRAKSLRADVEAQLDRTAKSLEDGASREPEHDGRRAHGKAARA